MFTRPDLADANAITECLQIWGDGQVWGGSRCFLPGLLDAHPLGAIC